MCPDVKALAALWQFAAVGTTWGASKLAGRNITKYLHPRKLPCEKVVIRGAHAGSRPTFSWGRPMTLWKKQVRAHGGTAGVGDLASKERLSELTSGSSHGLQGLRTTCKDSSNEAKC